VAIAPGGAAATRAGVATKWPVASSGDRSDNLGIALLIVPESKLLWKRALGGCWRVTMLVPWSRLSSICASYATRQIAKQTSNLRRMRCGPTAAQPAN
jgi:hypothetical protein